MNIFSDSISIELAYRLSKMGELTRESNQTQEIINFTLIKIYDTFIVVQRTFQNNFKFPNGWLVCTNKTINILNKNGAMEI